MYPARSRQIQTTGRHSRFEPGPQPVIRLTKTLNAWGTPAFGEVAKREIEQLGAANLPLQQGLSNTSYALDTAFNAMIISASEEAGCLRVRAGIFYSGIIAGCSCADDPTPVEAQSEYCEMRFDIDKVTAATTVTIPREESD